MKKLTPAEVLKAPVLRSASQKGTSVEDVALVFWNGELLAQNSDTLSGCKTYVLVTQINPLTEDSVPVRLAVDKYLFTSGDPRYSHRLNIHVPSRKAPAGWVAYEYKFELGSWTYSSGLSAASTFSRDTGYVVLALEPAQVIG